MHELMKQRATSVARINEERKKWVLAGMSVVVILATTAVYIFA